MTFKYDRKLCCHLSNMILSFFNRQFCLRKVTFCRFFSLTVSFALQMLHSFRRSYLYFHECKLFFTIVTSSPGCFFLSFILDHLLTRHNAMFCDFKFYEFVIFREVAFSNSEYIIICFTDTQDHLDVANYFTNIKHFYEKKS